MLRTCRSALAPTLLVIALGATVILGGCSTTQVTSSATTATGSGSTSARPTAAATAAPPTTAQPANGELRVIATPYGQALGRNDGKVLYAWDDEPAGVLACTSSECTEKWPAFTAASVTPAPGIDTTRVGLADRPDGTTQVTLDGRRLYTMAVDQPGQANCQGADGWWILNPDGSKNTTQSPVSPSTSG